MCLNTTMSIRKYIPQSHTKLTPLILLWIFNSNKGFSTEQQKYYLSQGHLVVFEEKDEVLGLKLVLFIEKDSNLEDESFSIVLPNNIEGLKIDTDLKYTVEKKNSIVLKKLKGGGGKVVITFYIKKESETVGELKLPLFKNFKILSIPLTGMKYVSDDNNTPPQFIEINRKILLITEVSSFSQKQNIKLTLKPIFTNTKEPFNTPLTTLKEATNSEYPQTKTVGKEFTNLTLGVGIGIILISLLLAILKK